MKCRITSLGSCREIASTISPSSFLLLLRLHHHTKLSGVPCLCSAVSLTLTTLDFGSCLFPVTGEASRPPGRRSLAKAPIARGIKEAQDCPTPKFKVTGPFGDKGGKGDTAPWTAPKTTGIHKAGDPSNPSPCSHPTAGQGGPLGR